MRLFLLPLLAFAATACAATPVDVATPAPARPTVQVSPATTAEQAGLVDVATLAPDIRVEMRYAGSDNFTGAVVPGYEARKCLLLEPAAEALAKVQADLRSQDLSLTIFDCYRPVRAVHAFVDWAHHLSDQRTKAEHYPNVDKSTLLGPYIAETSGHSRGATVDLGIIRCKQRYDEALCDPLDMGADFDLFDPRANTDSPAITEAQRANRQLLLDAMKQRGFVNYPMEWWHFTFKPEPTPTTAYDVPVK
ncbi:M15 family metallopeptidase [Pseudoluteimonas lycopersici]|uniref:D-alanyl-D-alanine dipeptidase n=1 Tax=Pseudoluteimonas lycopersici TaxID=1324796 RepID=A0A516V755_9GAMM|nr:M15 family metallopeptidase [Lysobacter lycopersici]QDQ74348.1 M15 family metallopeptidase [Lysobacter lycopersici]